MDEGGGGGGAMRAKGRESGEREPSRSRFVRGTGGEGSGSGSGLMTIVRFDGWGDEEFELSSEDLSVGDDDGIRDEGRPKVVGRTLSSKALQELQVRTILIRRIRDR